MSATRKITSYRFSNQSVSSPQPGNQRGYHRHHRSKRNGRYEADSIIDKYSDESSREVHDGELPSPVIPEFVFSVPANARCWFRRGLYWQCDKKSCSRSRDPVLSSVKVPGAGLSFHVEIVAAKERESPER